MKPLYKLILAVALLLAAVVATKGTSNCYWLDTSDVCCGWPIGTDGFVVKCNWCNEWNSNGVLTDQGVRADAQSTDYENPYGITFKAEGVIPCLATAYVAQCENDDCRHSFSYTFTYGANCDALCRGPYYPFPGLSVPVYNCRYHYNDHGIPTNCVYNP